MGDCLEKRGVRENEMGIGVVAGDLMECDVVVLVDGDFDALKLKMAGQVEF